MYGRRRRVGTTDHRPRPRAGPGRRGRPGLELGASRAWPRNPRPSRSPPPAARTLATPRRWARRSGTRARQALAELAVWCTRWVSGLHRSSWWAPLVLAAVRQAISRATVGLASAGRPTPQILQTISIDSSPPASTEDRCRDLRLQVQRGRLELPVQAGLGLPGRGADSPQSYSGLSVADHSFSVRATDAAGNVDASAGDPTAGRSRRHRHRHRLRRATRPRRRPRSARALRAQPPKATAASFSFSSSEAGSSFQCKLDSARLDGLQLAAVLFRALGRRSQLLGAGHRRGRQRRRRRRPSQTWTRAKPTRDPPPPPLRRAPLVRPGAASEGATTATTAAAVRALSRPARASASPPMSATSTSATWATAAGWSSPPTGARWATWTSTRPPA